MIDKVCDYCSADVDPEKIVKIKYYDKEEVELCRDCYQYLKENGRLYNGD